MKLSDYVLELLYPTRCTFCHKFTQHGEKVCEKCRRELPVRKDPELNIKIPHISRTVCPFYYENYVRDSLLRYKFNGLRGYAQIYGEFLAKSIDETGISCDIITWVPLSKKRFRQRGYDQARLIAENVALRLGKDCVKLIEKTVDNPAQSGTGNAEKRKANVKGVYRAVKPEVIKGKRILIIDDIITTGATISECAGILRKCGAVEVLAGTVAGGKN